jgi:ABC-type branched-subunit amino acid transport system substrate-binding protein
MKRIFCIFLVIAIYSQNSLSESIPVGISLPLTGAAAEYGAAVRNGFLLAKENEPELKHFNYVFDDNAYLAAKSVDSYHKLRNVDHAQIIYHWGEPGFASVAPIAEAEKFPFFCMSTDRAPGIGRKYSIRVSGDSYQLQKPVADFLEGSKAETVYLLMADDPYFEAARLSLTELLKDGANLVTIGTVPPDTSDFRSLILKLKKLNPKFTAVFLQAGQVRVFFNQAAKVGFKSQFIGTDVFESREEIKESGPQIDGSVYGNFYVPGPFAESYVKRFGNDSQISHAYMAYAFAIALSTIAPKDSSLTSEVLLENLEKLNLLSTEKRFRYIDSQSEGKHFEFPVVLRQIHDGMIKDFSSSSAKTIY